MARIEFWTLWIVALAAAENNLADVALIGLKLVVAHGKRGCDDCSGRLVAAIAFVDVSSAVLAISCAPVASSKCNACSVATGMSGSWGVGVLALTSCESGISGEFKISRPKRGLLERGFEAGDGFDAGLLGV